MRSLLLAIVVCVSCSKGEEPPAASTGSPGARPETGPRAQLSGDDKARALFSSQCAMCHGIEGKGDGPAATNLNPKPRDYTDAKWQASVTDDDIKRTITMGGQKLGKSAAMPPNPQLQPDVLDGLVRIIRGFGRK
jgi:mono/diheme cytochrome c family protein